MDVMGRAPYGAGLFVGVDGNQATTHMPSPVSRARASPIWRRACLADTTQSIATARTVTDRRSRSLADRRFWKRLAYPETDLAAGSRDLERGPSLSGFGWTPLPPPAEWKSSMIISAECHQGDDDRDCSCDVWPHVGDALIPNPHNGLHSVNDAPWTAGMALTLVINHSAYKLATSHRN